MRSPSRFLLASFLAVSCAQPAPPPAATAPANVVLAPAPPAASSATKAAEAPRKRCIPAPYRTGWVSDAFANRSSAAFCLAISEKEQTCWTVLPDGLADCASRTRPPPWPRASSSGSHSILSDATSVKVCRGSSDSECHTISPKGFRGADQSEFPSEIAWHIPADASPDGSRIMLVRHEGKRSEKVFVEIYDTAAAKRLARFPVEVDQFVSRVAWIGRLALLTTCVEEGPGCSIGLFDPDKGKSLALTTSKGGVNVYGIENPVRHTAGDSWAVVETDGARVLIVNASTGALEAEIPTGLSADVESGVEVASLDPERIAIISGAPRAGDLVVVDLVGKTVASRFEAPTCPAAP